MVTDFINIGLILILIMSNLLIYRIQNKRIASLENTSTKLRDLLDGQSKIISDFERYKSLFDIEDFEKRLKLKLDNQALDLQKKFDLKSKEIIDVTLKSVQEKIMETEGTLFKGWEELCQIAISVIMKEFPKIEDKQKRDSHIRKFYPLNSIYFIGFIDDHFFSNNKKV